MEMGIYYSRRSPVVVILCLIPFHSICSDFIIFYLKRGIEFYYEGRFSYMYICLYVYMWMYADAV